MFFCDSFFFMNAYVSKSAFVEIQTCIKSCLIYSAPMQTDTAQILNHVINLEYTQPIKLFCILW